MEVQGKVAIVTGASAGIGLATARLLAQQGAQVALVARSRDKLQALAAALPGALAVPADLSREDEIPALVARVMARYGRVDILINNAGQGYEAEVAVIDTAQFRELFALNVIGPLAAMQAVIPLMRRQGQGAIVNISSGTSLLAIPNLGAYSSLKRALNALSLTARAELAADGIIVSVVYPFVTATDFAQNVRTSGEPVRSERGPGPPADTAEHVAAKILEVLRSGAAQHYAHEWMQAQSPTQQGGTQS
ncbi:MAG: SDR family NAD(P)-dependent oxidoreductase [Chloroflexia bacterium]